MLNQLNDTTHKRYNPLTDEWVLVSPHRTKRPWQGRKEDAGIAPRPSYDPACYLCPDNERAGGQTNPKYKSCYVFTNDFAALNDSGEVRIDEDGLLIAQMEKGICKVICFSPDHSLTIPEMELRDIAEIVKTWKEEFIKLSSISYISNVQIFENKGSIMGCSNPHPHGQIWAQSSIPNEIQKRTETQENYFSQKGKSLLSDYLRQEIKEGIRVVTENEHFVCLVPFWAIWPYETMIIPRRHFQAICDMTEEERRSFASIIRDITIRYDNLFETSFPYSAGMQQRPTDSENYNGWHFHYSFYPPLLRSATVKKFMVGYEMFANPQRDITSEDAAKRLRAQPSFHYKQLLIKK